MLLSLSSPDESSLSYEVEFLLQQRWVDQRLQHESPPDLPMLNALFHVDKIWLPDTYFIKHGTFKTPMEPSHMSLRVERDGTVTYIFRRSMVINCQGNLDIFPFDNPKCPFALESVSHEMSEMVLQWREDEMPLSRATSLRCQNAYLVWNETGVCDQKHTWRGYRIPPSTLEGLVIPYGFYLQLSQCPTVGYDVCAGEYSCLKILLLFTRDKSFYFSTVFVPGMVLVASSFISFWLDVNAVPARVMLGVTTMLNFCTTTNSFRGTLPVVSNLTAMNMWDGVCMFFIYASMLEFIVVNYLYRQPPHGRRPSDLVPRVALPLFAFINIERYGITYIIIKIWPGVQAHNVKEGQEGAVLSPVAPVAADEVAADGRRMLPMLTWIRRPLMLRRPTSRQQLSHQIDNISKLLFPLLFGLFVSAFFLTFAFIKPDEDANWKLVDA
ncbi:pHCl [Cordylochernes scorpioides]|uniref:PHCl n=1 Tax=Cordylochernes scorpioides TaxID=51811 RepID=A0ABY6LH00_9ARAC|nr:pHCl [Cordylochernes scorpioides]